MRTLYIPKQAMSGQIVKYKIWHKNYTDVHLNQPTAYPRQIVWVYSLFYTHVAPWHVYLEEAFSFHITEEIN